MAGSRVGWVLRTGSVLVAFVLVGSCTAERDPNDAAAGPGHADAALDADDLHYLPTQLSTTVGEEDKDLDLDVERRGDGYRLVASTVRRTFEITVAPTGVAALRHSEIGAATRRAAYEVDESAHTIGWTDALATVTITASDTGADELELLADAMVLVDTVTYEAFLADPGHRFEPGEAVLGTLPLADRTLRIELTGTLSGDGLGVGIDGVGPGYGSDGSGITVNASTGHPQPLLVWQADGRNRALLFVPDGFVGLTSDQEGLRWWQGEDANLGRVVLLDGSGDEPLEITVAVEGTRDQDLELDPMDWL